MTTIEKMGRSDMGNCSTKDGRPLKPAATDNSLSDEEVADLLKKAAEQSRVAREHFDCLMINEMGLGNSHLRKK